MSYLDHLREDQKLVIIEPGPRGACLVAGCPCKDARIVSRRQAAFFAAIARRAGETADRFISADPAWRIPTFEGAQSS